MISVDVCSGRETRRDVNLEEVAARSGGNRRDAGANDKANGQDNSSAQSTTVNGATTSERGERSSVAWIDMVSPTDEEWTKLERTFHFHPLAIEDARKQDQRVKLDAYDGYRFLSVRAWVEPETPTDDLTDTTVEMDVFLGPNYLITIHDNSLPLVEDARKRWQRRAELDSGFAPGDADPGDALIPRSENGTTQRAPAYLLYLLLDAIVDAFFPVMDKIDTEIDELEMSLYDHKPTGSDGTELKRAIRLRKRLLLLRQAVTPMREVINELLRDDDPNLLPLGLRAYWQDVYDHTLRLVEQIDLHRDILGGVVDAVMAMASHRLNQVMKTMTAVSTILMSAALISGIYGMNVQNMWLQNSPHAFNIIMGVMVFVAIALVWYFRRIKWF